MIQLPLSPGDHIFGYLRDSGHEDQDLSVDQQESALRRWAAEHGLIIMHIYKDEERKGSSTVGRDQLQEMMHAFRHGSQVQGVVVWKYNRFARSVDNAQFLRAEIRTLGYHFVSMNDKVPDGPMGRLFEAAIDFKDEQYLIDLSIDVKRGLRDLVVKYGCRGGKLATGFKKEPVTIGMRRDGTPHIAHKWVPDPEMKARVFRAFEMRDSGASLGSIHKETKLMGGMNSYRTFFANPIYKGALKHGDDVYIEDYYEAMVPRDLWDRVQVIQNSFTRGKHLKSTGINNPRRSASRFLLSGIAHCGLCGSPLYGHSSKVKKGTYDSYFCTRAYRKRDCSKRRVPGKKFEQAVIDVISKQVLTPSHLHAAYEQLRISTDTRIQEQEVQRSNLTVELSRLRKQITNLTNSLAQVGASKAITTRLKDLEIQETDLMARLAELDAAAEQPIAEIPQDVIEFFALQFGPIFNKADLETKRSLVRLLIERVDVHRTDVGIKGIIHYYYPPEALPKALGPTDEFVPTSHYPSGPPRCRHKLSIAFELMIVPYHKKDRP